MTENLSVRRNRLSMAGATRTSLTQAPARSKPNGLFDSIMNSAKRRSTLSTPASKRRQSSLIPSSQPEITPVQVTPSSAKVDQRPLRDKNYQNLLQQEIYDFLSVNKFELEMNHPLTARTLKQPTQKDFVLIFQFLYGKIDPNHKFTKSIQTEVTNVLKMLNYPYLDGINRSQIMAVGGSNWPAILGMLYWLVKLNLSLLHFNEEELISPDDRFDKYFIKYIMSSYRAYIAQQEDYSEYYEEMKQNFDKANEELVEEIAEVKQINQELQKTFEQVSGEFNELKNGEVKSRALENDLVQFQAYIETMESRKLKWGEIISKIELEITNCEQELNNIKREKKTIEDELIAKGFSIKDIDNLNSERDKLLKSIDTFNNKIDEIRMQLQAKDIDLTKNYQSLDNFIKQYNNTIFKIPSINYDFEIRLNQEIINGDKIFKPEEIINKILKNEKVELLKYRSQLNTKIHQDQDEAIKLQEQSDLIGERITEQQEEIDTLEARLTNNKSNYNEAYETMLTETNAYSMQIEKLQRELRSIKINTNQGFIEVENRFQNLSIEFDELDHEIFKQRSFLHDKIQKIIEFTITFKINIQQNIEDLDLLVTTELENEQKTG